MDSREVCLLAPLEQVTQDPAWRCAQAEAESRKLAAFAVRLLAWDGRSEELPEANPPGGASPARSHGVVEEG